MCRCPLSSLRPFTAGGRNRGAEEAGAPSKEHQVGACLAVKTGLVLAGEFGRTPMCRLAHGLSMLSHCLDDLCPCPLSSGWLGLVASMVSSSWDCLPLPAGGWLLSRNLPLTRPLSPSLPRPSCHPTSSLGASQPACSIKGAHFPGPTLHLSARVLPTHSFDSVRCPAVHQLAFWSLMAHQVDQSAS